MQLDWFHVLDHFLPTPLLQSTDQTRLLKGRVLVFLSLMYLVSLGSMVIVFTLLGALGIFSLWGAVLSSFVSCCLYTYQLYYFKHGGDAFRAANIGMCTMVAATAACALLTGGWTSPVMMILLCTPTCAFLMEGKRTGLFWSATVVVIACIFLTLHIQAIALPHMIDAALLDYLSYCAWIYGFMIVASGTVFYGSLTDKLNTAANLERQQLKAKATFDPLTHTYYRQAFQQRLPQWLDDYQKNGRQLLFFEMDIEIKQAMQRDHMEDFLVRCVKTLQLLFSNSLLLSRNSGSYFQCLLSDVHDRDSATTALQTLHNQLSALPDAEAVQITVGAVMVPGYTNKQTLMLQTARKAIQEARTQESFCKLYTEADRPDIQRLITQNVVRCRYNELINPTQHN